MVMEGQMGSRKIGCDIPCFCITWRNLTMTLDEGRIRTWRLPAFSALLMFFRASLRTEVRTILAVLGLGWVESGRFSNLVRDEVSTERYC